MTSSIGKSGALPSPPTQLALSQALPQPHQETHESHSMDSMLEHFAGRGPVGTPHPVVLSKQGHVHTRSIVKQRQYAAAEDVHSWTNDTTAPASTVLSCGLACSEIFSGPNLAAVLTSGYEYEGRVLEALRQGHAAPPLALHTSGGVPAALGEFLQELRRYLPWRDNRPRLRRLCDVVEGEMTDADADAKMEQQQQQQQQQQEEEEEDDWCVSLQLEGASAVMAAVDLAVQLQHVRQGASHGGPLDGSQWLVGVGATSYHGPPSTALGSAAPLLQTRHNQVLYPVPSPYMHCEHKLQTAGAAAVVEDQRGEGADEERELTSAEASYLDCFTDWLDAHGKEGTARLACMLVEPQWGSSAAGFCWPPHLLRRVVKLAQSRSVLVIADEIMCGLGRHGNQSLFLSEAWRLGVDAVTFGKAIAGGVYALSGVVLRRGAAELGHSGRTVMQSHTYSGSHVRALMAATEVFRLLPRYIMRTVPRELAPVLREGMLEVGRCGEGVFMVHGQGLMWGALLNRRHALLREDAGECSAATATAFMNLFRRCCASCAVLPYFVPVGGFMVTPLLDCPVDVLGQICDRLRQAVQAAVQRWKRGREDALPGRTA